MRTLVPLVALCSLIVMQASAQTVPAITASLTGFAVDPSGSSDSSAGVQSAVNYVLNRANGGTIRIPAGTYKIAAQVSVPKITNKLVTFECDAGAQFLADGALTVPMFYIGSPSIEGGGSNFLVKGCTFSGANGTTARAFKLENANIATFRDNAFRSLHLAVEMVKSYAVEFDANLFEAIGSYAIYSSTSAHHLFLHGNKFYHDHTSATTFTVLLGESTDNLVVRDNVMEGGWTFLGMEKGGSALTFEGNYLEYMSNTPFYFASAVKGASIRNNWIALSGNLVLNNITGGAYVNNSSYEQTVGVNGATTSDLEWRGNSHLGGAGSLAYTGTKFTGNIGFLGGITLTKVSVGSLPNCNTSTEGLLYAITDAASAAFNAPVAGGGSNHVMAYCNGTTWTVH